MERDLVSLLSFLVIFIPFYEGCPLSKGFSLAVSVSVCCGGRREEWESPVHRNHSVWVISPLWNEESLVYCFTCCLSEAESEESESSGLPKANNFSIFLLRSFRLLGMKNFLTRRVFLLYYCDCRLLEDESEESERS